MKIKPNFEDIYEEYEFRAGCTLQIALDVNAEELNALLQKPKDPMWLLYMWFEGKYIRDIYRPSNDIKTTTAMATDKCDYGGQAQKRKDKKHLHCPRNDWHISDALNAKEDTKLCESDAFLRDQLLAGEEMFAISLPINTTDKEVVDKLESQLMMFMWALASKSRKLKNVKPSSVAEKDVNYVWGAQLVNDDIKTMALSSTDIQMSKFSADKFYDPKEYKVFKHGH